jgi:hypothetical protein
MVNHFRVFGCPCINRPLRNVIANTTSQKGVRVIFLGFTPNQQGWLVFFYQSVRRIVSNEYHADETFSNEMSRTWIPFYGALSLLPIKSLPPKPDSLHEHTGDYITLTSHTTLFTHPEEGNDDIDHNILKILMKPSFQDSKISISISTSHNNTHEGCKPPEDSTGANDSKI